MRTTWILGNWKQNHLRAAAQQCAAEVSAGVTDLRAHGATDSVRVGIAPPYLSLETARPHCRPASQLWLFAQDCAAQDSGAFTGEVGPAMLADAGVHGAIIGHSERRTHFGEDDTVVAAKLGAVLDAGLAAVLCVGEQLEARDNGTHESVVITQLSAALSNVSPQQVQAHLVIAYEPVWAIGTGRTASPEQASAMHAAIRTWMTARFGDAGHDRSVLYGGSVNPGNASALLGVGNVDGFLVGGASLDPTAFVGIVRAAASTAR